MSSATRFITGAARAAIPTASSVVSDLAQIAAHFPQEQKARNVGHEALHSRLKTMDEIVSRYYLRLLVVDRPGVLADVARVLASRQIGISSVIQPEAQAGEITPLVLMLHDAPESQLLAAVRGDRQDRRGQGAAGASARRGF